MHFTIQREALLKPLQLVAGVVERRQTLPVLSNVLLRQLSAQAGAAETILFRDGRLTEASASNVFIVKRGVVVAPPKSSLILPGITYDVVVELARADGMPLELREVTEAEVRAECMDDNTTFVAP